MKLIEIDVPGIIEEISSEAKMFVDENLHIKVTSAKEGGRWHMSISHPERLPTWDEIKEAREIALPPNVFFCLPFPPKEFWINIHDYCLHLWEIQDQWLVEQMIYEGGQILP